MNGVPLWVFMVLLGALGTLLSIGIAMIVRHFHDDQRRAVRLAVVESDVKGIKAELGDHDSGLRGWLHQIAGDISPYIIRKQDDREK
jgi:hypothetical protein